MVPNRALVFVQSSRGVPVPREHVIVKEVGTFDIDAPPPEGTITTQTLYASLDPSMRLRMTPPEDSKVFTPYQPGELITSTILMKVLRVDQSVKDVKEGDVLRAYKPIQEYHIISGQDDIGSLDYIRDTEGIDLKVFPGPLGSPGLAACAALNEIGKPKKGETILVSAASGAVGQTVGQLAKHYGLTVLGIVGSDEKVNLIKDLGFDGAINYKKGNLVQQLRGLAPNGVDIFYDNVGGEILEAAIELMRDHGRIVNCGAASQYNLPFDKQYGIRNLLPVVSKSLTLRGFSSTPGDWVFGYSAEHREKMRELIKSSEVKPILSVTKELGKRPGALVELFRGDKTGKAVLDFCVS
ncbi:unnamed protein product [Clonostachys byssicola]|uniref:Dehydrogenase FUB6 n=1 Tax=Clonostachys byssicola TaxID=160290 RepID=A0A9N9UIH6_9HYPO|nr:unnamed protein product [Clonostachys byssicola]